MPQEARLVRVINNCEGPNKIQNKYVKIYIYIYIIMCYTLCINWLIV